MLDFSCLKTPYEMIWHIFSPICWVVKRSQKGTHICFIYKKMIEKKEGTQKDPLNGHQKILFVKYSVIFLHSLVIVTFPFVLIL